MYRLTATYKVTTPLFAGGAGKESNAELRPPSFKGVLRFWYRAVSYPFQGNDWRKVAASERKLFGSTDSQAMFLLKLETGNKLKQVPSEKRWPQNGSAYLGYGFIEHVRSKSGMVTTRPYIKEGFRFKVILAVPSKKHRDPDCDELIRALKAVGLFGGMGSRSRKGFGSLSLESIVENDKEIWTLPEGVEGLQKEIVDLFEGATLVNKKPEYTAFSARNRVALWPSELKPLDLLDEIGKEMVRYRSYGQMSKGSKGHTVLSGEPAEQNFTHDHNLVRNVAKGKAVKTHPKRVVFGLPHNYFFSSTGQKVDVNAKDSQRRASPLFIHIHQLANHQVAVFTLLPAKFLPTKDQIVMAVKNSNRISVEPNPDYRVINDYIDRFSERVEVML